MTHDKQAELIDAIVAEIDKRIDFRRNNQNDPHNIDTAVMVALMEVRGAIQVALKQTEPDADGVVEHVRETP